MNTRPRIRFGSRGAVVVRRCNDGAAHVLLTYISVDINKGVRAAQGYSTPKVKNMIDVMDIKLKVIKAACGITALSELELLHRLEELYLDGMKAGADALRDATVAKANAQHSEGQSK
jgi:hypothetical protein